jgi:hypothetical protein
MKDYRFPLIIVLVSLYLAACGTSSPIPAFVSPTPPPIPTDIPVDFPEITSQPQQTTVAETSSASPAPSPTPAVPSMIRLTEPGCCVQPFWSPDGREVRFIDQPQPTAPTGIYGVSVEGGEPYLVSETIGLPSPDGRYRAFLSDDGETIVQNVEDEAQWVIPNGGTRVFFSPGSARLAWTDVDRSGNFDLRKAVISVSDVEGNDPREVDTLFGGGIAGWLDDDHLLLAGREQKGSQDMALFSLSVLDGTRTDLILNQHIRSVRIAPGGKWIVYTITLHPTDAENDGLWVINADGSQRYKLEVVGGAQWRDESHLLVIPLEPDAPSHRLWQFDAPTGEVVPITDPEELPFRVLAGDWSVSPTGEHVVFVNAEDQALWLITLPPVGS